MLDKQRIIQTIKELPQSFTIDELMDHLVFVQKVESGMEQSKNGQTISNDEAKNKLGKWLK